MKHLEAVQDTINHIVWTLALQGVLLIVLAILILLYPPLLVALVAATFMVIGVLMLFAAWKVHSLWQKVPGFLKK